MEMTIEIDIQPKEKLSVAGPRPQSKDQLPTILEKPKVVKPIG